MKKEQEFLELVRTYPSPHNGQPMVMKADEAGYRVYFQTDRGLTATPISYLFSFVTVGVFFRHIELCAEALGHVAHLTLALPVVDDMAKRAAELYCGTIVMEWYTKPANDTLLRALQFRQTSRKKYHTGLSLEELSSLERLVGPMQSLRFLDARAVHEAVWLNQRAVFDDMFDPAVRDELSHWLRFSHEEKITKRDGLSYDCMELNGAALRFIVRHPGILRWPVVAPVLRQYYLRTMQDNSSVGYLVSAFEHEGEAYEIGRTVMDIWIELSKQGKYLHPFGTVVSNEQAHKDFAHLAGEHDESRASYIVFIFRAGVSDEPVRSARLPLDHLCNTGDAE